MRQYVLTDRDFEDFYNIMCSIEERAKNDWPDAKISNKPLGELISRYRYYFVGWRNDVMSGDTSKSRFVSPPTQTEMKKV